MDPATQKRVEDWGTPAKKMLGDMKFLENLQTYDKETITEKHIKDLQPLLSNEMFNEEKLQKVNVVAANMSSWVIAMEAFYKVNLVVRPMKEELAVAQAKFAKVDAELSIKKEALRKKQAEVDGLRAELKAIQDEKQQLQADVADCEARLITATKLIEGLGGEKARWKQQSEELAITFVNLTGDVLISSGMIAYLGAFDSVYRGGLTDLWVKNCEERDIPNGGTFSL